MQAKLIITDKKNNNLGAAIRVKNIYDVKTLIEAAYKYGLQGYKLKVIVKDETIESGESQLLELQLLVDDLIKELNEHEGRIGELENTTER